MLGRHITAGVRRPASRVDLRVKQHIARNHRVIQPRRAYSSVPAAELNGLTILQGTKPEIGLGKGKKVFLVEFWATWCGPCVKSIPHLSRLAEQYKDKNVEVIGITDEENKELVQRFINKMGKDMTYTVAIDTTGQAFVDYLGKFNVNSIPHIFLVGKTGTVDWHGHPLDPALVQEIEKAIAK